MLVEERKGKVEGGGDGRTEYHVPDEGEYIKVTAIGEIEDIPVRQQSLGGAYISGRLF